MMASMPNEATFKTASNRSPVLELTKVKPAPKRFGKPPAKLVEHATKRMEA